MIYKTFVILSLIFGSVQQNDKNEFLIYGFNWYSTTFRKLSEEQVINPDKLCSRIKDEYLIQQILQSIELKNYEKTPFTPIDIRLAFILNYNMKVDTLVVGKNDVFKFKGKNYLGGKCLSKEIFEIIQNDSISHFFPILEECK
jgi:hypothetical protein